MREIKQRLENLPAEPGVYIMKDKAGEVIYVGKAVNLRERVRSYFSGADERAFVPFLEDMLGDIETVVVRNEKEALLLENELIHRYTPRFNVRPKTGKHFVYLRLDPNQRYPRLEVTRQVKQDGARYFGPYPLAHALRETLRLVNRHFKLRTCSDHDPAVHQRPCLLCQIARFPAPSVYDIPQEEYRRYVNDAMMFLQGETTELESALRQRMDDAAREMRFEAAARLRDQLTAVQRTLQPQRIVSETSLDQDAVGFYRQGAHFLVYMLYVRHGRVIGGQSFPFRGQRFPDAELLAQFLSVYYAGDNFIPDEVLLPLSIDGEAVLSEFLAERRGGAVRVRVGDAEGGLVKMSMRNAAESFREPRGVESSPDVLERLRAVLGLSRLPLRMECFDVSHFHGDTIVAAKSAMKNAQLDKQGYRRYRIKSVTVGDDFAAMYEVVFRRLRRGRDENDLPDLLVIDGGKGQLSSARAAMRDLGIADIDVIALAKEREASEGAGEVVRERFFLPERRDPVILPADSPEMLILARLRDEAHRFAVTYQRKRMRDQRVRSELERIPGIGPAQRRALLRHFGSMEEIREADEEALKQVAGIGAERARRIYRSLHKPH